MFKIHYGKCSCGCEKDGLIVVKKGYRRECNERIKKERKKQGYDNTHGSRPISDADEKMRVALDLKEKYGLKVLKSDFRPIKRTPLKRKFKKTGEKPIFLEIWGERPHNCQVCKKPVEFSHFIFSHVLGKQAFPKFRLKKENILIKCYEWGGTGCHTKWEHRTEEMRTEERWQWVFELYDKLKQEYYQQNKL